MNQMIPSGKQKIKNAIFRCTMPKCKDLSKFRCDKCGELICEHHTFHSPLRSFRYPLTYCKDCLKKENRKRKQKILFFSALTVISFIIILIIL